MPLARGERDALLEERRLLRGLLRLASRCDGRASLDEIDAALRQAGNRVRRIPGADGPPET